MESFEYVRKSITPEHFDNEIIGIYDTISKEIYKSNLKTLMHFGAEGFALGPVHLGKSI
jgi:hypothetical protein